ncbi:MAG: hypothetical protein QM674_01985 [Burkholderiaceae bacterium]
MEQPTTHAATPPSHAFRVGAPDPRGIEEAAALLCNREYRVLKHNPDIYRQRFDAQSDRPYPETDLGGPRIGYVELAAGMGVPAARVTRPDGSSSIAPKYATRWTAKPARPARKPRRWRSTIGDRRWRPSPRAR